MKGNDCSSKSTPQFSVSPSAFLLYFFFTYFNDPCTTDSSEPEDSLFPQLTERLTISFDVWFCCPYHPDKVALIHRKGQRQLLINREGNELMGLSEWHLTPNPPNPKKGVTPSQFFILAYSWTSIERNQLWTKDFIYLWHPHLCSLWNNTTRTLTHKQIKMTSVCFLTIVCVSSERAGN